MHLEAHNKYRALHGAPAMVIDARLAAEAQKYAEYLDKNDKFDHADNIRDGENLAWTSSKN